MLSIYEKQGIAILHGGNEDDGTRDLSVVRGWLARSASCASHIHRNFGWGIVQEEFWSPARGIKPASHDDVPHRNTLARGKHLVKKSDAGRLYVEDRWVPLVQPVRTHIECIPRKLCYLVVLTCLVQSRYLGNVEQVILEPIWQMFEVDQEYPRIYKQVYWTLHDIPAGTHLYPDGTASLEGVEEWNREWHAVIPDDYLEGCKKLPLANKDMYVVYARLQIVLQGLNVVMMWHLAPAHYRSNSKSSPCFEVLWSSWLTHRM